eukprot:417865-Rhodomonas_salina.1
MVSCSPLNPTTCPPHSLLGHTIPSRRFSRTVPRPRPLRSQRQCQTRSQSTWTQKNELTWVGPSFESQTSAQRHRCTSDSPRTHGPRQHRLSARLRRKLRSRQPPLRCALDRLHRPPAMPSA